MRSKFASLATTSISMAISLRTICKFSPSSSLWASEKEKVRMEMAWPWRSAEWTSAKGPFPRMSDTQSLCTSFTLYNARTRSGDCRNLMAATSAFS